ncbi:MAG: dethiobiotin synthetase [Myxococcales bacterium]|nr:dethiobiotin synthetase [Myxococcales bacterium]
MNALPDRPAVHLGPGLFITGTDTGVGKTAVGCALARLSNRIGRPWVPFKPVETGCLPNAADADALWQAARPPFPREHSVLYRFPLPAAPAVAAAAAGTSIDIDAIVARAVELRAVGQGILVEGAGGLLVPYRGTFTTADLAVRLALPLLVVARAALGTINHTALTLSEIRRRSLALAGLVLVETAPNSDDPALDHSRQIAALSGIAPLGRLPFLPDLDPDHLADALAAALRPADLDRLLAGRPLRL